MAYYNLASVEAVTSVPKAVNTFHDQGSKDVRDHDKELIDRLALPLDNISEPDWNALDSGDDSECFFPCSPDAYNDVSNSKLVSTPPHDTNIHSKALRGRITSTKGIQPVFTIVGSSNISLEITNRRIEIVIWDFTLNSYFNHSISSTCGES